MQLSRLFYIVVCAALISSCGPRPAATGLSDADRTAIQKTHAAATALAEGNPAAVDWDKFVDAHYAPDAILLPPNAQEVKGRDALIAFFKSFHGVTKFKTHDVELEGSGDLAYIRGTYELAMQPPGEALIEDIGKYIEVWRKDKNGQWRTIRDIFNSDK